MSKSRVTKPATIPPWADDSFVCPVCKSKHPGLTEDYPGHISEQYCPDCEAKTGQLIPMRRRDA